MFFSEAMREMSIETIFKQKAVWKQNNDCRVLFETIINNKLYLLKMNDFPEEPMYTVSDSFESIDFDDLPKNWKINCQDT